VVSRLATGSALLAVGFTLAASTAGWQSKKFEEWTVQDAQSVMNDSPWSKKLPMPAGGRPAMTVVESGNNGAPGTAALGDPANATTGLNTSSAGNAGPGGSGDSSGRGLPTSSRPSAMAPSTGAPEHVPPLTIVWASAAPVRLAILKLRSGPNAPTEEQIANAHKANDFYVIAVSGLPLSDIDPQKLWNKAFLSVKGKPQEKAAESSYRKIGTSDVYFFRFRRDSFPIAASDKEVEFKVSVGSVEIKRKFPLHDMQFDGNLAL
jgi:hypothetical protein